MVNLSREYCAYFAEATEVWKRFVIGEVIVALDTYRDSVCQTLQDTDNSGANASTGGEQDINNQEEMFSGVLENVLENAQQLAEQRIINALNQTLNQPPSPPVSLSPVVSILSNQTAQVNPPGESAISQIGVNSVQNDDDGNSLDVSIKSEVDSSSESECESDTDDDEMQVKKEPTEEENITARSEQTDNANNSNDHRETNDSPIDHSNEAANEQESNGQAMMIDGGEASLEEDTNGSINMVVSYSSPLSSLSNAEQSMHSSEFISHSNPDNQINMNENEIASHDEIGQVDAEDDADVESDNEDAIDDEESEFSGEELDYLEQQDVIMSDEDEDSVADDDGDDSNEDAVMDETNDEDADENMSDIDEDDDESDGTIIDDTNYEEDDEEEEGQASPGVAGPSSMTLRRSTRNSARVTQASSAQEQQVTRRVSKRQTVAGRSSNGPRNGRNEETEPLRVITKKLKCTVPGCKKVVKNKSALNVHLLSAHKLKKYRCLVRRCYGKVSTSFTTKDQLSDHLDQVHGRTSRLACHCGKKFNSYHDLSTHHWQYHELGQFACSKNGCSFKPTSTRTKVESHLRSHGEAKHVCPVDGCDRSFKKKSNLDRHILIHSGERPFPCTECDQSFSRKDNLTAHLLIHRNNKCYRCTWHQCTYSSTSHSHVLRHIRTVHFELPATKKQQAEEEIEDDRDPRDFLAKD